MKKIDIVSEEKVTVFCDIEGCGKELSYYIRTCRFCRRDLCMKHIFDDGDDDYSDHYCPSCWEIGIEFRSRRQSEITRHYEILDSIENEWRKKALAALESKKENKDIQNEIGQTGA